MSIPGSSERMPYEDLTIKAQPVPGALMLQTGEIPWTPNPDGGPGEFKLLSIDPGSGGWTTLNRFPAGAQVPMHLHMGAVEIYTIKGTWSYQEGELSAGGYAYEPSGVLHEPDAESEVELFIVNRGGNLYFDGHGRFVKWVDYHMLYTAARANGAADHLGHLDHLLVARSHATR